jgi:hypothetical protein
MLRWHREGSRTFGGRRSFDAPLLHNGEIGCKGVRGQSRNRQFVRWFSRLGEPFVSYTPHRDQPRSIWSRNWPASCGASLAEAAAHRHGLDDSLLPFGKTVKVALVNVDAEVQSEWVVDAIRTTTTETEEEIRETQANKAMTSRAMKLLSSKRNDASQLVGSCDPSGVRGVGG